MELRWSEEAAADLERIADHLFEHFPERAVDLMREIYNAPAALLIFPYRGRTGKKPGTREFVLAPLPYIVIYEVIGDIVHLARIVHGAQEWP